MSLFSSLVPKSTNKSAYRSNLFENDLSQQQPDKWYKGDTPTVNETLGRIYSMKTTDPVGYQNAAAKLSVAQSDPSSMFYNPFTRATNKNIDALAKLGYNVDNIDDDWYDRNAYLMNYYETNSTTNNVKAPTKDTTKESQAAYYYNQVLDAREITKKAQLEAKALDEEIGFWTNWSERNYSDEQVRGKVRTDFAKKYPTLQKMLDSAKSGEPINLNSAVPYATDDWIDGRTWAYRNDGGYEKDYKNQAMAGLGQGNLWQEDQEITDRLNPKNEKYAPYTVSSTLDDACAYYGVNGFQKGWLEANRPDGTDPVENSMYNKVFEAEKFTQQAEGELDKFNAWLSKILVNEKDPEKVMDKVKKRIDNGFYPALKDMNDSLNQSPDKIKGTTRAIDFSPYDIRQQVEQTCARNSGKLTGDETIAANGGTPLTQQTAETIKTTDGKIRGALDLFEEDMTDMELSMFRNAGSSAFNSVMKGLKDIPTGALLEKNIGKVAGKYVTDTVPLFSAAKKYNDNKELLDNLNLENQTALLNDPAYVKLEAIKTADPANMEEKEKAEYDQVKNWFSMFRDPQLTKQQRMSAVESLYEYFTGEDLETTLYEYDDISESVREWANYLEDQSGTKWALSDYAAGKRDDYEYIMAQNEWAINELEGQEAILDARIDMYKKNGYDTTELETAKAVSSYLTEFSEKEAKVWQGFNYYEQMMMGENAGATYAEVAEDAAKGNAQFQAELKRLQQAKEYIEKNNIQLPDDVVAYMAEKESLLNDMVTDYKYFTMRGEADFDEMVAKGRELEAKEKTPLPEGWAVTSNWMTYDDSELANWGLDNLDGANIMEPIEKDNWYYLYAKKGKEAAIEYYKHLYEKSLPTRNLDKIRESAKEEVNSGFGGAALANFKAIISSPIDALASAVYMIYSAVSGDVDPSNQLLAYGEYANAVNSATVNAIQTSLGEGTVAGTLATGLYEILYNEGRSLVNAGAFGDLGEMFGGRFGSMLNEFAGASPMALGAAANAMASAKRYNNADNGQAWLMGLITFIGEDISEGLTYGNIKEAFKGGEDAIISSAKDAVLNWLKSSGVEEMIGEVSNDVWGNVMSELVLGENSDRNLQIDALTKELMEKNPGMLMEDARKQAEDTVYRDEYLGYLHTAIISYLSPGLRIPFQQVAKVFRNIQDKGRAEEKRITDFDAAMSNYNSLLRAREAMGSTVETTMEEAQQLVSPNPILSDADKELIDALSRLDAVADSDVSTQTAAIVDLFGEEENTPGMDMAKAAAVNMAEVFGSQENAVKAVSDLVMQARIARVRVDLVLEAVKTAALSPSSEARKAVGLSADATTSDGVSLAPTDKVIVLAGTVSADAVNEVVQAEIAKATTESRVAEAEKDIIAANPGAVDTVTSFSQIFEKAEKTLQEARDALKARRDERQAKSEAMIAAAQAFADNPTTENKNAQAKAMNELDKALTVEKEYEQHLEKAQADYDIAWDKFQAARGTALTDVRQQAEQAVADQNAQRAEVAKQKQIEAEQQAKAEELQQDFNNAVRTDAESFIEKYYPNATDEAKQQIRDKFAAMRKEISYDSVMRRYKFAKQVGKKFGVEIEVRDTTEGGKIPRQNAYVDLNTGRIVLDQNATQRDVMYAVLVHELTHIAELSETYDDLANALIKMEYGDDTERLNADITVRQELYNARLETMGEKLIDQDGAKKEIVADLMGRLLSGDQDLINRFAAEEPSVARRILDSIKSFLKKMVGIEGAPLTDSQRVVDMLEAALKETKPMREQTIGAIQQNVQGLLTASEQPTARAFDLGATAGPTMDTPQPLARGIQNDGEILDQAVGAIQQSLQDRLAADRSGMRTGNLDEMTGPAMNIPEPLARGGQGSDSLRGKTIGAIQQSVQDKLAASERTNTPNGELEAAADQLVKNTAKPLVKDSKGGEIATELPGGTVAVGSGRAYSLSTFTKEEQARVRDALLKKKNKDGTNEFTPAQVDRYMKDALGIARMIAADRGRLDFDATENEDHKAFLKHNDEYFFTLDASTLCAKRLLYQGTFNAAQHMMPNTAFMPEDLIDLVNIMREMGYETPCGICYVESRRRQLDKFANEWLEKFQGKNKPTLAQLTTSDGLEELRINDYDTYKAFVDAMNKKGSSNPKVVQLRTAYDGDIRKLSEKDIQKVKDIGGLRVQSFSDFETPHLLDMVQAVYDMSSVGLTSQAYTKVPNFAWVFGDTGIKINLSLIGKGTGVDENGNLVFDNVEGMNFDEAMKLRERYSKNVGTILVGMNDAHIIAAMGDPRIDYIIPFHKSGWSREEIRKVATLNNYSDYTDFQNERVILGRETVTKQFKTGDNEEIKKWIRNQRAAGKTTFSIEEIAGKSVVTADGYKIQSFKNEADGKKEAINATGRKVKNGEVVTRTNFTPVGATQYWDFTKSGEENARNYLAMCAKDGRMPKFWKYLVDNGDGSFSLPTGNDKESTAIREGYWKTLVDFKMYENDGYGRAGGAVRGSEQTEVKPNINMDEAYRVLNDYKLGRQMPDRPDGTKGAFISMENNNSLPAAIPAAEMYVEHMKEKQKRHDEEAAAQKKVEMEEITVKPLTADQKKEREERVNLDALNARLASAGYKGDLTLGNTESTMEEYVPSAHNTMAVDPETGETVRKVFSLPVTDEDILKFLNDQEKRGEVTKTYRTMKLLDGKLVSPKASFINGKIEGDTQLGQWEAAAEHPELIKFKPNGEPYFELKEKGRSTEARYNPYMHSSNLMLNDQFKGAYQYSGNDKKLGKFVTVECIVPNSEATSGYKAQYAKDPVGWTNWKAGGVAQKIAEKGGPVRNVFLSRWIKPVRIVPDSEVAQHYKELLGGTGIKVPANVVTPSLLAELEKAGVEIGPPEKQTEKTYRAAMGTKYSFSDLSSLDQDYAAAVARGDIRTATNMLLDRLQNSEDIIPFVEAQEYSGQYADVARLLKKGIPEAVTRAAQEMASFVPDNAVLIPMPPHTGKVTATTGTKVLADAIAELTGRPVVNALEGDERESSYERKKAGKGKVTAEEMGMRQVAELPEGTIPIFVDNVVASGETAKAARKALGGGITLSYAKGKKSKPTAGLKRYAITYDNDGNLIPLSQRFNRENPDIRYSLPVDAPYMSAVNHGDMETAQELVDKKAKEAGYTKAGFHGTLNGGFTIFDKSFAGIGGNSGAGFYFSSNPSDSDSNYRDVEGADNWFKANHLADQILEWFRESDEEYFEYEGYEITEGMPYDEVVAIAKKILTKNPQTYHVYLDQGKTYIRDYRNSTNLLEDALDSFDEKQIDRSDYEDEDEYYDAISDARYEAIYQAIADAVYGGFAEVESNYEIYSNVDMESIIGELTTIAMDYETLSWDDLVKVLGDQYIDIGTENMDEPTDGSHEIARAIIEAFGYDSIEDREVSKKFNQLKNMGNAGDTVHYIMFRPEQIKLADPVTYDDDGEVIPLSERFKKERPDIRYSLPSDNMLTQQIENYLRTSDQELAQPVNLPSNAPAEEGGSAQRQFGHKTAQESDALHQEVKDYLYTHSSYTPDSNQAQIDRAINWVQRHATTDDPDGFYAALNEVESPDFDYRSADGQARMLTVMGMAALRNDRSAELRLADAFNKQGTDLGRQLQARKLFRLMTPVGRKSVLQSMAKQVNDEFARRGSNTRLELPQLLLDAAGAAENESDFREVQEEAAKVLAAQIPANWKDKLTGWRMLAMLGNPRTHIRNILGNAMFMPMVGIKNKVGAIAELGMKTGNKTKTIGFATKDARAFAKQDAQDIKDTLTGEAKYNDGDLVQRNRKTWGTGKSLISKTLGKILQGISDFNGRALEAEDWIFLNRHYRNALAGYMTANKLTSADMTGETLEKARTYAVQEAQKATYRDFNKLASDLSAIARKGGATGFVVNAVLPFKKTPANILKRGIEYSPVGIFKALTVDAYHLRQYMDYQNGKLKALPEKAISPNQWIDKIASGLTGTAVLALGGLLSSIGAVRAGFDDDDPEDQYAKERGEQEYALNPGKAINRLLGMEILGEDVTMTIDWTAPMSMPLFVGAAMFETVRKLNEGKNVDALKLAESVLDITEPVFNLSMLDGVNSLLDVNNYGEGNAITQIGEKVLTNYATSYVPTLVGQVARTLDTVRRKSYVESGAAFSTERYAWEKVENKIPFLSKSNIPYRNVWGDTSEKEQLAAGLENFLSPAYWNTIQDDAVIDELQRLYESTIQEDKKSALKLKMPGKTVSGKKLDAEKYDTLTVERGQTAKNLLTELMASPEYEVADDTTRAEMISDIWTFSNQRANNIVAGTDMDKWVSASLDGDPVKAVINRAITRNMNAQKTGYKKALENALVSGKLEDAQTAIAGLRRSGKSDSSIKTDVTNTLKPLYQTAFLNDDFNTMNEIEDILDNLDEDIVWRYVDWVTKLNQEEEPEGETEEESVNINWLNRNYR